MKKRITTQTRRTEEETGKEKLMIGLDLGDRSSRYCVLDGQGDVMVEGSVATTRNGLDRVLGAMTRCRVALEAGTHKDDKLDAMTLARLARIDPELLSPIRHRSEQAQADLIMVRARAALVETRTALINAARCLTKSYGERLPSCGTNPVGFDLAESLSPALEVALAPLL